MIVKNIDKYIRNIEQAEDLLLEVFWDIRDERGFSKQSKRLDTILYKIDQIKHLMYEKKEV